METRTLKLVLEYDGTNYSGWQRQLRERTVQNVIEDVLEQILHKTIRIVAAGRTDAGVHAKGQVASFKTTSDIDTHRLMRAMNGILPRDITVVDITETHPNFHARFDAVSRAYRYTMSTRRLSLQRAYVWHVKYTVSRELLELSTRHLNGSCNLRGFSKGNDKDDFSTEIVKNLWTFHDNLMIFDITAVRFFHHSVRSIVGSAVEIARGNKSPDLIRLILDTRDRSLAGPTAPAQGLCLVHVDYGESNELRPSLH